jgi:transposase InsO family protein
VWQLTAIDTATRWAVVMIVLGVPSGKITARFLHEVVRRYRRLGVTMRAVLTDNGPEYVARTFTDALAATQLTHERISPRSRTTTRCANRFKTPRSRNAGVPRSTAGASSNIRRLQAEIDAWLVRYNTRRRHHSDYMRGRTPLEILDTHRKRKAA